MLTLCVYTVVSSLHTGFSFSPQKDPLAWQGTEKRRGGKAEFTLQLAGSTPHCSSSGEHSCPNANCWAYQSRLSMKLRKDFQKCSRQETENEWGFTLAPDIRIIASGMRTYCMVFPAVQWWENPLASAGDASEMWFDPLG